MLLLKVRVIVGSIDGGQASSRRQLLVLDDYLVPERKKVSRLYLIILTRPAKLINVIDSFINFVINMHKSRKSIHFHSKNMKQNEFPYNLL